MFVHLNRIIYLIYPPYPLLLGKGRMDYIMNSLIIYPNTPQRNKDSPIRVYTSMTVMRRDVPWIHEAILDLDLLSETV